MKLAGGAIYAVVIAALGCGCNNERPPSSDDRSGAGASALAADAGATAEGGAGPDASQGGVGPSASQGSAGREPRQGGAGPSANQGGAGPSTSQGGAGREPSPGGAGPGASQGGAGSPASQGGVGGDAPLAGGFAAVAGLTAGGAGSAGAAGQALAGACSEGTQQARACGLNGRGNENRLCANGEWSVWSCIDSDSCRDGLSDRLSCGLNDTTQIERECEHGQWSAWSNCVDPDVCTNGGSERRACGFNAHGTEERRCAGGAWSDWSACQDGDACREGASASQPCGVNAQGTSTRACVAGQWLTWSSCSVECGNGAVELPEECDDHNLAPGDGCSKDCRLERVRWIAAIPLRSSLGLSLGMPLRAGRLSLLTDPWVYSSDTASPELWTVDANGMVSAGTDFRLKPGTRFSTYAPHVSNSDLIQLNGSWNGADSDSSTGGKDRGFVRYFDSAGVVASAGELNGGDTTGHAFTTEGDLFLAGTFSSTAPVSLVNAHAFYPSSPGRAFWFLRVGPQLIDFAMGGSLTADSPARVPFEPEPPLVELVGIAADATQEALLFRNTARAYYLAGEAFGADARSLLLLLDLQGKKRWHYGFPSNVQRAEIHFLSSGQVLADVQLFIDYTGPSTVTVQDPTGTQQLGSHAIFLFAADGSLLLARPGQFVTERADGALVVRENFQGAQVVAPGTPEAHTLHSHTSGPSMYVAAYRRDGTLLNARTVASWPSAAGRDLFSEQALVGETSFVLVTDCDPGTQFGEDGALSVSSEPTYNRMCLVRSDFEGRVQWAAALTRTNLLALDHEQIWLGEYRTILRLDDHGQPNFHLDLAATLTGIYVRDGNAWATGQLDAPFKASIAPSDPQTSLVDASTQSQLIVVSLRP